MDESYYKVETDTYPDEGWDETGIITIGSLQMIPLSIQRSDMSREESRKKFFLIHDTRDDQYYQPIVFSRVLIL